MSNETQRPKTKKLRNATPNINLPIIDSQTNKFNWKTLSESNVYILKKLPEVNSKDLSLNQLDQLDQQLNNNVKNKINIQTKRLNRKELIKQNSSTSFKKDYQQNLEQFKTIRSSANEYNRPSTNQKMQINIKCYLCNKEFNAKQIITHETECLDKWRQLSSEEKRKAIEEQKDCLLNLDEQPNQWKKFKSILSQCSKCGRNFFEHRLNKHELNCKVKQNSNGKLNDKLDSLTEDEKEEIKLNENSIKDKIVFLRKTKPLNSRSNQLYKQSSNLPTLSNQLTVNPQLFNTEQSSTNHQSSDQANPEIDNNELINKNNLINQTVQLNRQNYFVKCSVCGRVCNKANMDTHMKIHRRSNLIQQQSIDDNLKQDKSIEKLNDKLNINNLSLDNMKTFEVNAEKIDSSSLMNCDNDSILENDKEILINLNCDQQKNNVINLIENNLLNQLNDKQLMFNNEEWNEHLSKLKRCVKCNRTFFADRIKKHQNNCKAQPI